MIMETHYYLINGTVKKGGEMPDGQDYMQTRRISFDELEDYFDNESYDFDPYNAKYLIFGIGAMLGYFLILFAVIALVRLMIIYLP